MFIACPNCRYLVATDPRTQVPPERCTRCGGALSDTNTLAASADTATSTGGQSFASLLRQEPTDTADGTPDEPQAPTAPAPADDSAPTAVEPRLETAAIAQSQEAEDSVAALTDDDVVASAEDLTQDSASPVTDEPATATGAVGEPSSARATVAVQRTTSRAPGFLRPGASRPANARGIPRWQWLSVVVLVVALLLQMLIADRARLAGDAGWRPIVVGLCNVLGCSVPPWREPQAFVMLDRDVRPLPGAPGVLQARATFRNDAHWAQPWPVLQLTLKDADGRSLGARAIAPSEYLRGGAANRELAPGQSAQVAVRIREPSASVVAFSFDFR